MSTTLIGDVHIGRKFRSRDIPLEAKGLREEILFAKFEQDIKKAAEDDVTIILGDLFDSPFVSYEDLIKVYNTLHIFKEKDKICIILAGNHDLPKEKGISSAFDLLAKLYENEPNFIFIKDKPIIYSGQLFVPYYPVYEIEEKLRPFIDQGYTVYGHFEEAKFPWLMEHFKMVYTGHIHSPRCEDNLVVVGSIMPLTFAEDPTNTFMRTCTLAEYEEDVRNGCSLGRCYRLKLKEGEELPINPQCLQMSKYVEEKPVIEKENLNVEFEPFDIEKLMHEALDNLGLFNEAFDYYNELKMAEIENV